MKFALVALFVAIVAIATSAAAEVPCLCTREFAPVCATDKVTYANACQFKCAKKQLVGRAAEDFKIVRGGSCDGPEITEFTRDLK